MQYELALKIEKAYKNTNYNNRISNKSSMEFNNTLISQTSTKSSNTLISQTSTKSSDTLISKNSMKKSSETLNSSNTAISKASRESCNTVISKTSRDSSYSLVRKALMILEDSNESNLSFDEIIENDNNLRSRPDKPNKVIASENFNNEIIHESSKKSDKIVSQSEACSVYDDKSIDDKSIDEITLMADSVSLSESSIYSVPEIANILEDFETEKIRLSDYLMLIAVDIESDKFRYGNI
ncbi:9896_t:CDS:2 [Dentiscutata erythropus]|uniref:9896_t:CDS:1 n=1 Tax=Dentiscutata erythropus TaxID=1348616 RepID=A0A9N8W3H4_9GLOM|nr:9896_t:CDS:2 [Dentiscutata erythropus]